MLERTPNSRPSREALTPIFLLTDSGVGHADPAALCRHAGTVAVWVQLVRSVLMAPLDSAQLLDWFPEKDR